MMDWDASGPAWMWPLMAMCMVALVSVVVLLVVVLARMHERDARSRR